MTHANDSMIVALDLDMDGSGHVEAVSLRRPWITLNVFASCYDARFLSSSYHWCAIRDCASEAPHAIIEQNGKARTVRTICS